MRWQDVKAELLAAGPARLTGAPADEYITRSAAGPGAGGEGSVFFSMGGHRVRLSLDEMSDLEVIHRGGGVADLFHGSLQLNGRLERPGLHCPRQAYITVTGSCAFHCRYCPVPALRGQRKTIPEIVRLVESVRDRVTAISLTSGVLTTIGEEETYVRTVVKALRHFGLPIGVSIYPTELTPDRLHDLDVAEVKFNIEAATPEIFGEMCPELDYDRIWGVLERSVALFGRNRVFSNVIVGLGETDAEMEECIRRLTARGIIPVLRPLNPVAALSNRERPSAERLRRIFAMHEKALADEGLDTRVAQTMCTSCTGCDLVPGRD
ncbi:MAG: lipoyl synthase [Methanoregula sp. PtaU1.Bin051]|nr:MAG: lipoyl synthase [Methanoregula sp. PtaU1.Bin051]